jgi:hypothetical protein
MPSPYPELVDAYDDNLICMTDAEWRRAAQSRLDDLGLTYEQLRERHERGNETTAETRLWMLIGGRDLDRCQGTTIGARQYDELTATLHLADPAPMLAAAARRRRRFRRS